MQKLTNLDLSQQYCYSLWLKLKIQNHDLIISFVPKKKREGNYMLRLLVRKHIKNEAPAVLNNSMFKNGKQLKQVCYLAQKKKK